MAKKVLIFDFDGTIADTTETLIEILNHLNRRFGKNKIDINTLRNKGSEEIRKELGISFIKIPILVRKVRFDLNKRIKFLKPIPNLRDTLMYIKNRGHKLGILTSNSKENVKKFLIKNQLDLFDFIYSESSVFSKSNKLKKLIKKMRLDRDDIFYIGDETRDIKAGKDTKCKVIAVSWGFNTREVLLKHDPDFLIDKPEKLINILAKESSS